MSWYDISKVVKKKQPTKEKLLFIILQAVSWWTLNVRPALGRERVLYGLPQVLHCASANTNLTGTT